MTTRHNHSITSSKICCPQHIVEISRMLKKQNRLLERGEILRKYLESHTSAQIMLSLKDDAEAKHKFLKMCNDEICQYITSGKFNYKLDNLESAKTALEKINVIHKSDLTISAEVKSAFLNTYAAYYEKIEDYTLAIMMIDEALKVDNESKDTVASAIDYNNKAVFLMNLKKYRDAYKCNTKSLGLLEHIVI